MKKAGAYGRVSTQAQSGNTSLRDQEAICRKYAEDHNLTFTKFYHDIQSGKNADRPSLKELIEDVKAKTIDVVLFTKLDRLGRSIVDIRDIYDQITAFDVDIISIQQPGLSTDSATGRLMLNVLGSFAEFERDLIRSRMMEGRLSAWKSGKSIGALPFGYEQDESGKITINKAQKKIIEKIVALYLDKKLNVVQIADEMSKQNIPTPQAILDKIRNEKRIKEGKPPLTKKMASDRWGPSTIHRLLTNEAYTGKVTYNKAIKNTIIGIKKKAEGTKPEDQWVNFTFPALISQERYDQIIARLKHQKTKPKRKYSEYTDHFMVDGFVFCGECGGRIRKIITTDNRVGKQYLNYACHWRISGKPARARYDREQCILKSVNADEMDGIIFSRMMEFLIKPQPDEWVKDDNSEKIKGDIAELYKGQSLIRDSLMQGLQYISKVKDLSLKAMYEAEQRKKEIEYQDITRKIETLEQDLRAISDKTARFEEFKKLSTLIKRNELKKHLDTLPFPEKKKITEQLINPDGGGKVTIQYLKVGDIRTWDYDPNLTMDEIRALDDRPLTDRDPAAYIDFRISPDKILDVIQGLKGDFIKSTRFL